MNVVLSKKVAVQPVQYEGYEFFASVGMNNQEIGWSDEETASNPEYVFNELKKRVLDLLDGVIQEAVDDVRDELPRKSWVHRWFPAKNETTETKRTRARRV